MPAVEQNRNAGIGRVAIISSPNSVGAKGDLGYFWSRSSTVRPRLPISVLLSLRDVYATHMHSYLDWIRFVFIFAMAQLSVRPSVRPSHTGTLFYIAEWILVFFGTNACYKSNCHPHESHCMMSILYCTHFSGTCNIIISRLCYVGA